MSSVRPTLDNTWGAALIGLIIASMLYGVTTLQIYIYFVNYPNDTRWLKSLATSAWILDTISLGLVCDAMYGYLVTDIANPFNRLNVNRSLDVDPAIMGILAFLTHTYLGIRVWKVCNRNKILGAALGLLSLTSLALALAASIVSFRFKVWTEKVSLKPLALAGTVMVVFLDTLIATILCVYLLKQGATGKEFRRVVRRVVIFAINTGLASSIMSTVNIVTFLAFPNTMVFLGSNFIFTKVYANCLLANLNVRESLRGKGHIEEGTLSLNLSALQDRTLSAIVYREPMNSHSSANSTLSPDNSKDELFAPV
ncbi:hypothetical protein BDZ97DRAFT_542348 [Flammula alnicola]|nr:hypothetical protein BDZ97DRAFT_542348 [Flammula alnicola]